MSDYPPPSYEAASYRQIWSIIAPYIWSEDLSAACLVSQEWHRSFAPQLWGNPSKRFGTDYDSVHFSLSRFAHLLPVARLEVRKLVHTLQLQPEEGDFYERPKPLWLRGLLDQLPSLQTLIASNLPFFDHQTLQTVHQKHGESSANEITYYLRMLIASGCQNTTGTSLGLALLHFSDLIYLDLSLSQGARSSQVLRQIGSFWELKILKLRRCGLRDEDTEHVSIPRSLLSLDISENLLTSQGLSEIFAKLPQARYGPPPRITPRYSDFSWKEKLLEGSLEEYVRENLTHRRDGQFRIEDGLPLTFSQLFLDSNSVDIVGVIKGLKHLSFDHLDCGSLRLAAGSISNQPAVGLLRFQQLNPVKFALSFGNLRSLRIHHSVITSFPFFATEILPLRQKSQDLEHNTDEGSLQLLTHKLLRHQHEAGANRNSSRLKVLMVPNLKVLTLTNLPTKTKQAQLTSALVLFIQECAEFEELARLEFMSRLQDFTKAPNWDLCPQKPLKLQKLVLELSSNVEDDDSPTQRKAQIKVTKSSTEDPDSEAFMQATEGDFSFFSDDVDSDQLVMEGQVNRPAFGYERSMLEERAETEKWIEIIPALAKFRKERKTKFEAARKRKNMNFERVVSGHWIGEIKLIRNS